MRSFWYGFLLIAGVTSLHATDAASVGGCAGTVPERQFDANPATYLVISHLPIPFDSTLLPIAKRLLMKEVQPNAA